MSLYSPLFLVLFYAVNTVECRYEPPICDYCQCVMWTGIFCENMDVEPILKFLPVFPDHGRRKYMKFLYNE